MFSRLFQKSITIKEKIDIPKDRLNDCIKKNRNSLNSIESWIDDSAFQKSIFQYGVPDYIKIELDKKISELPTYSDYILYFSDTYFQAINYLEIGVSVGKNFFQIINGLEKGSFTGFDIEEIYPILERKLAFCRKIRGAVPEDSIKKNMSSLAEYNYEAKKVAYLSADVFNVKSWQMLKGNQYNVIFSDALHSPEAILFEFEMLLKFNLLSDKFIIFWDDLVGEMKDAFLQIAKKYAKLCSFKESYILQANGWVGEYEEPHIIGIISNFSF